MQAYRSEKRAYALIIAARFADSRRWYNGSTTDILWPMPIGNMAFIGSSRSSVLRGRRNLQYLQDNNRTTAPRPCLREYRLTKRHHPHSPAHGTPPEYRAGRAALDAQGRPALAASVRLEHARRTPISASVWSKPQALGRTRSILVVPISPTVGPIPNVKLMLGAHPGC